MTNNAQKFYQSNLINLNHTLLGSMAIRIHKPEFREAKDVDLAVENINFVQDYLKNIKNPDFKIININGDEYEGFLHFRLEFSDNSFVDFINAKPPFVIIDNIKVGTLESILKAKKMLLHAEIEKEVPRIEVIKKHFNDLKFCNNL